MSLDTLISTYVFSGSATVQVLHGLYLLSRGGGGYDKAELKVFQGRSPFNPVLTIDYMLRHM